MPLGGSVLGAHPTGNLAMTVAAFVQWVAADRRLLAQPRSPGRSLEFRRRSVRGGRPGRRAVQGSATEPAAAAGGAVSGAVGVDAGRLARFLAADWANRAQAWENPQFWAHIHVCFRPLPFDFLGGYALYCESAYDYDLGMPYKTAVLKIVPAPGGVLELETYRIRNAEEFWLGAHEPQLLDPLRPDMLVKTSECCNTVYEWSETQGMYRGYTRPGRRCLIQRNGKETYLDSIIELTKDSYSSWDRGRDPETHERIWGGAAGPFRFVAEKRLDHLVEDGTPE